MKEGEGLAKEHICMTHGQRQWCGDCLRGGDGQRWAKWKRAETTLIAQTIKFNF